MHEDRQTSITDGPAERPLTAEVVPLGPTVGLAPEVKSAMEGRATETATFRILALFLVAPFGLGVPLLLLILAAVSGPSDTSRAAQLTWAFFFIGAGVIAVWLLGRGRTVAEGDGLTRVWGWRTRHLAWPEVLGFSGVIGAQRGLWVIRTTGRPLRLPTPWHEFAPVRADNVAAFLNHSLGLRPPVNALLPQGVAPCDSLGDPDPLTVVNNPTLLSPLKGRSMSPGWLTCFLTVAVPLSLLLPITLLVLAACSHARHSTRVGEVVWAIVLFALVFPWVLYALRARTTTTGDGLTIVGWRRTEVPWGEIQLFVGKTTTNSGRPPRTEALAVMTKAGKRLPVPSAVRRVAIGSATALNQAFGLGYQLRYCQRCHQQYEVGGACSHHPAAPVSLGQISDGAAAREPWIYPCCGRAVLAAIGPQGETIPPARYPGCQTTEHAPVIRW